MKPFHFSLEPLRSLRKHKEEAVRQRYAQAVRACEEAAARVQQASVELTACWKLLYEKLAAGVTGEDLLRARAWCNVLELRVKERSAALEQARLAVDAVWKELMTATREREMLDKFRDNRRRAYDHAIRREEQKNFDEVVVQLAHSSVPSRGSSHSARSR
jgi:flagellar export protein FliJ